MRRTSFQTRSDDCCMIGQTDRYPKLTEVQGRGASVSMTVLMHSIPCISPGFHDSWIGLLLKTLTNRSQSLCRIESSCAACWGIYQLCICHVQNHLEPILLVIGRWFSRVRWAQKASMIAALHSPHWPIQSSANPGLAWCRHAYVCWMTIKAAARWVQVDLLTSMNVDSWSVTCAQCS